MLDEHTASYVVMASTNDGPVPVNEIAVLLSDSNPPDARKLWTVLILGPLDALNEVGAPIQITCIRFLGYYDPPAKKQSGDAK
jgi:hypothetical protein